MLRLNTVELPARFFEKADLAIKIASSAHQKIAGSYGFSSEFATLNQAPIFIGNPT
jgi:hypothetical protein